MHIGLGNFLYRLNQWRRGVLLMIVGAACALERFAPLQCLASTEGQLIHQKPPPPAANAPFILIPRPSPLVRAAKTF
jgi:hypothetical protein